MWSFDTISLNSQWLAGWLFMSNLGTVGTGTSSSPVALSKPGPVIADVFVGKNNTE